MMNVKLVEAIKQVKEVQAPEWAVFVKTGVHKDRVPTQKDWWYLRTAAILAKIERHGPLGVNRLSKLYGGRKNRGYKPEKKMPASTNIIRKMVQQLTKAGLIHQVSSPKAGKILTKQGKELLNKVNN